MKRPTQVDREVLWHPFTHQSEWEPLAIAGGDGNYLMDGDGAAVPRRSQACPDVNEAGRSVGAFHVKRVEKLDREVLWHPLQQTPSEPLMIDTGRAAWLERST